MSEHENAAATEFTHAEWACANVDKYNNADKSRYYTLAKKMLAVRTAGLSSVRNSMYYFKLNILQYM